MIVTGPGREGIDGMSGSKAKGKKGRNGGKERTGRGENRTTRT